MEKTAILTVNMVYDFANENGLVYYPRNEEVLSGIRQAVDICRQCEALAMYLQHRHHKDRPGKNLILMCPDCIEGSGGEEIGPLLEVLPQDYVIKKRRCSASFGTDFDLVLREYDIRRVIVAGTKTNYCIRAMVTDTYSLDYGVCIVRDCVVTDGPVTNEVHLTNIHKYLGHVSPLGELEVLLAREEADGTI